MDWKKELYKKNEKPLDNLVEGYSNTAIFRTIGFVGDSLASGEFEIINFEGEPDYFDLYDYSWGQYLARKNGLKGYNFSRGGMTAREYMCTFAEEKGYWDKEKACQAYVIALGVNDLYNTDTPVGSIEDICLEDYTKNKPTFMGYYGAIISRYKEISPGAKFFLLTAPKESEKRKPERVEGFYNAIFALADLFEDTYVLDFYTYAPTYDEAFREKFYLHGHLNPMGYIFTAKLVDSYIDYIIRQNPQDFKYAGLIGTDIAYKE